jgi:hypothetical protein
MSDVVVNSQAVLAASNASVSLTPATAGAAITAGQSVYKAANGYWYPAYASGNSVVSGTNQLAIALNSAYAGQPIQLFFYGNINLGSALNSGNTYILSYNAGRIAQFGDLNAGMYTTIIGWATNSTTLYVPSSGPLVTNTVRT